ncbi:MAG: hypothetical protein EGP82_06020 [Odoribacter splanchnicus]|nr:hypothetical protein [Odoribacter splanchnicus]
MKRIALLILSVLLTLTVFAQTTPGAKEKNAGNDAWKAKNYAEAFKNFEAYLKAVDFKDNAYIYNTATAAAKAKNYAAAEKYYDMAIKNKYKTASAYHGKAIALKEQKKTSEMLTTLEEGMKAFPGNVKLEQMYATYFLKEGQNFQKAGNEAKAAENYLKIVSLKTKSYKTQGYLSLATLYFNNGAKVIAAANPIANTDKAKFESEKAKAVADFKKAKDYLMQAQSVEPANQDVKDLMKQVNEAIATNTK